MSNCSNAEECDTEQMKKDYCKTWKCYDAIGKNETCKPQEPVKPPCCSKQKSADSGDPCNNSCGPVNPCDPTNTRDANDPRCYPSVDPCDPCYNPCVTSDPCDPCSKPSNPISKPNDTCVPVNPCDPCSPCIPCVPYDPCDPKFACSPPVPFDPCNPIGPCSPTKSNDPCDNDYPCKLAVNPGLLKILMTDAEIEGIVRRKNCDILLDLNVVKKGKTNLGLSKLKCVKKPKISPLDVEKDRLSRKMSYLESELDAIADKIKSEAKKKIEEQKKAEDEKKEKKNEKKDKKSKKK